MASSLPQSIQFDKSETRNKGSRTNSNQAKSIKGDESTSVLVFEPTVQEKDVNYASQLTESATADNMTFDELDGEDAADEPAVSLKKALIYGAECLSFDRFGP